MCKNKVMFMVYILICYLAFSFILQLKDPNGPFEWVEFLVSSYGLVRSEEFQSAGCKKVLLLLSCPRSPTIYQRPLLFRCVILHLAPIFFPAGKELVWTHACSLVMLFSLSYSLLSRFIDLLPLKGVSY